jgi:hypothetical protein
MIKTAAVEDVADVTSARAVDQSDEIAELRRRLASAESDKTTE